MEMVLDQMDHSWTRTDVCDGDCEKEPREVGYICHEPAKPGYHCPLCCVIFLPHCRDAASRENNVSNLYFEETMLGISD